MTLAELEDALPCGFHDTEITALSIDYARRRLSMSVDVWVAGENMPKEAYRRGELVCDGLEFCSVDPPESGYRFMDGDHIRIDIDPNPKRKKLPVQSSVSKDCFVTAFYVMTWNSWITIAARTASLTWTEPMRDRDAESP